MGPMTANSRPQPSPSNQEKGPQTAAAPESSPLSTSSFGNGGARLRSALFGAMVGLAAMNPQESAGQEKPLSAPTAPVTPEVTLTKTQKEVTATLEVVGKFLRANGASAPKINVADSDALSDTLKQFTKAFNSVPYYINGRGAVLERIRIFESALKDHPFNPDANTDSATTQFSKSVQAWKSRLENVGEWREPAEARKTEKESGTKGIATPLPESAETIIGANLVKVQMLLQGQGRPLPTIDLTSPKAADQTLATFGVELSNGDRRGALNVALRVALVDLRNALDKNPKDLDAAKRFSSKIESLIKDY